MRRLILFFALLLLQAGCQNSEYDLYDYTLSEPVQITLSYFTGTNLKSYFNVNLVDAKSAIKSGVLGNGGRYLYLLPESASTAKLYEVTYESGECVEHLIKEYSDFASLGDGSMSTVIEYVKSYVDFDSAVDGVTKRMNLVISGHGTGWIPSSLGAISSVYGFNHLSDWSVEGAEVPTRYMGSTSDGFMDIDQFASELEASNVKFGFILFDECFMSSVEMLYRIRDYTDYVVASPCEVMAAGFPYDVVLPYMFVDEGSSFDLEGICEAYYDFYSSYSYPYGSVAVCALGELEALAQAQSELTFRDLSESERLGLQAYEGRSDHVFYDLKQYVNLAADGSSSALLDSYNAQFDKAFPESCRLTTGKFYTNIGSIRGATSISYYSGVTTSAPTIGTYSSDWTLEPWAIDVYSAH